jgi:gamma-glutamyltranspeptidase / glutathione hydrolase
MDYFSRRSPVLCRHGMVACSQPLAAEVGLRLLRAGANAAEAAVGTAAAMAVLEPCSTGLGGDAFALFFDAKSKTVTGLNGSGRSPANLSFSAFAHAVGQDYRASSLPTRHAHAVTVPGAAAAWVDAVSMWGRGELTLASLLAPAIDLARNGFPVAPITAAAWHSEVPALLEASVSDTTTVQYVSFSSIAEDLTISPCVAEGSPFCIPCR